MGTTIDLDGQGKIGVNQGPVTITVHVIGSFDGQASNEAIIPAYNRSHDTATGGNPIPAGRTRDIQVAGVQQVPAHASSMAAVDFHLEVSGLR